MNELLLSLLSSVVAASAAWVGQWLLRYRRLARKRTFFGVTPADGMPTLRVGTTVYPAASERAEYVVLAKAYLPATPNPVFVLAGQTARSNLAAARFLASQHRKLLKSYGLKGRFCLVLKVGEPLAFGPDFVEIAGDVTADAFQASVPAAGRLGSDGG